MTPFALALALALAVVGASAPADRATRPTFQGQGTGSLELVEVPENVPLELYVVQCIRAEDGEVVFSVHRSGRPASPPTARVGEEYVDAERGVRFRIAAGETAFAVGDAFSFLTYAGEDSLDELFDRWVNEYVRWIISREERARFEALSSPVDKLAFIESFWRRRDPDPTTPENERRAEHARRFAYALRHFGAGVPGWATDRGKIYIILGPPSAIERNPAGRTAFERPSEIWTYNDPPSPRLPASFDIGFVDFTGTGRYEIVSAKNLDFLAPLRTNFGYSMSELEAIGLLAGGGTLMDPTTGLRYPVEPTRLATDRFDLQQELADIAKIPEAELEPLSQLVAARADFPTLPLRIDGATFRGPDGLAVVPITLSVPYARLTPTPAEGGGYRYSADVLVRLRDERGEEHPPIEDRIELAVGRDELEDYRESALLYETAVALPPGRYRVEAILRDNPSGALGRVSTSLVVEPPAAGRLELSSLLVVRGAVPLDEPAAPGGAAAPFHRGGFRLVPSVDGRFEPGGRLVAYVEAYGFSRGDADDTARLRVEYFILRDGRLFSKVAPSYHRPAGRDRIAIKSDISLGGFPPGEYVLRVRVTDERRGSVAERDAPFLVGS